MHAFNLHCLVSLGPGVKSVRGLNSALVLGQKVLNAKKAEVLVEYQSVEITCSRMQDELWLPGAERTHLARVWELC